MSITASLLIAATKALINITCKVDVRELEKVPDTGPLLVVFNHINFLDAPLIRIKMMPRDCYALTKQETWDNPIFRVLANNWGGIPIDRENPAISTMRNAEKVLKENKILFVAPEGTRSGDGVLQSGNTGITALAVRTKAVILPIAHIGTQHYWKNLKRFRRTPITFKVGPLLKLDLDSRVTKQMRQDITDELMEQLAALLPSHLRGIYQEPKKRERNYFIPL